MHTTSQITPQEFRDIRHKLKLDQGQMADMLGYSGGVRVSEIETGLKPVNYRVGMIMMAMRDGWRPPHWPGETE